MAMPVMPHDTRLIVVEGHGENEAAKNLVSRLWLDLNLDHAHVWTKVYRVKNINTAASVSTACEFARAESFDKLLILRDEDDKCPKDSAPICTTWVRTSVLKVPVATVLLHREYETLFLASLSVLAGRNVAGPNGEQLPGISAGTEYNFDYEDVRGVKEWLSRHFDGGTSPPYISCLLRECLTLLFCEQAGCLVSEVLKGPCASSQALMEPSSTRNFPFVAGTRQIQFNNSSTHPTGSKLQNPLFLPCAMRNRAA